MRRECMVRVLFLRGIRGNTPKRTRKPGFRTERSAIITLKPDYTAASIYWCTWPRAPRRLEHGGMSAMQLLHFSSRANASPHSLSATPMRLPLVCALVGAGRFQSIPRPLSRAPLHFFPLTETTAITIGKSFQGEYLWLKRPFPKPEASGIASLGTALCCKKSQMGTIHSSCP